MRLNEARPPARLFTALALPIMLLLSSGPCVARENPDSFQQLIDTTVSRVKPALVRIYVVAVEDREGREVKMEASGSGVIITPQGHVVTNHHVAGDAKQITCTMADKSEVDADLVGTDPLTDIAMIKLRSDGKRKFPAAKFGDSSAVRVGDRVFAMGSPLAFSQSVTMGVISNTELVLPKCFGWLKVTLDGEDVGSIVRWIAHDADIFPGNSGGPLVNMKGEIIGINEIALGLSGAIPGNLAREVAEQIIENGEVSRSWLGIEAQPLLKSSERREGVLISGIISGSPAEKADLRPGDILLSLAGKQCTACFQEEVPLFNQFLMSLPADRPADAEVLRDGKRISLKITPVKRARAMARPKELKEWGICASNITFFTAKEKNRRDTVGVLVTSVRPGGPAGDAKPSLTSNDVIVEVAGKTIGSLQDLCEVTESVLEGKEDPAPTIVKFERDAQQYLTVVKLGAQDMKDPGLELRKAWLPAKIQVLTKDIAAALNMEGRTGMRVTQVYPNSTAEKAGLRVGDIIVALDGSPVHASQPEDTEVLPAMIRQYKIGSTADFTIIRDGQEQKLSIELPQSPKLTREMKKHRDDNFELTVRDVSFFDRVQEMWPEDQQGVLVESVSEGGWASLGGLNGKDLILSVDGKPVRDVTGFQALMEEIGAKKPETTIFQIRRGIHHTYVEVEPAWESR